MDSLNEYQKRAAEYKGKHLLVLAGAGTGKTKTIIARAEFLINSGIPPNKIVILSFTRKSAKEIAERLKNSIAGNVNKNEITGKTFHSWCNEIMHQFPDFFPHHNYTPLDEDDRLSAMALCIGRNFRDTKNEKFKKEIVVSIYSYAVNKICSLSEAILHKKYSNFDKQDKQILKQVEEDKSLITPIIKKYIEYKKERKYIDYDDMLSVVAETLEKNEIVRYHVTNRYTHILIDEMQDTNPLQYKLLKSFIDKSNLFCVGDDAQSIYGFRGADFKTIHSFSNIIPESETFKLLLNYRSTQEILDLSNWILEQSPLKYDKKLISIRGNGDLPNLIHVEDEWDEAEIITETILKGVSDGNKFGDSLVLGRTSWSLSKIEGACLKKKIPYIKLGGTSLMQSAHVRDVVSAMRIIGNIYDEIAWIRFLQLWEGIGEIKAEKIISKIIILETFEKMLTFLKNSNIKELKPEIATCLEKINIFISSPSQAMNEAVNSMEKILKNKYKDEWDYRILDFEVLKEVAKSTTSINEFITEYVLDPKAETTIKFGVKPSDDSVTLSTIHSSKGLEAKEVFVSNVAPMNYPSPRSIKEGLDSIEEERRCLYVAVTRAKDKLNLYRNIHSYNIINPNENENLYFLANLPVELTNIVVEGKVRPNLPNNNNSNQNEATFPDFNFE